MPLTITRRKSTGALTISGTIAGQRIQRRAITLLLPERKQPRSKAKSGELHGTANVADLAASMRRSSRT
jgi:hypothetical protein